MDACDPKVQHLNSSPCNKLKKQIASAVETLTCSKAGRALSAIYMLMYTQKMVPEARACVSYSEVSFTEFGMISSLVSMLRIVPLPKFVPKGKNKKMQMLPAHF